MNQLYCLHVDFEPLTNYIYSGKVNAIENINKQNKINK